MPRAGQPSVTLPLHEFGRSFALRARDTAWLLGAGASAEAGIATGWQLVDRLLVKLYGSASGLTADEVLSQSDWSSRVYPIYDGQLGLPRLTDDAFYSAIFEHTYPDRDARARFVMQEMSGAHPHHGQQILAGLVASGLASLIITTNFDRLPEDAIRDMLSATNSTEHLTVLDPLNASGANFALAADQRPLFIKIHGDLGTITLSNTDAELASHDPQLRAAAQTQLSRYGLIELPGDFRTVKP